MNAQTDMFVAHIMRHLADENCRFIKRNKALTEALQNMVTKTERFQVCKADLEQAKAALQGEGHANR